MKPIKIRRGIYETNSSSSHSIVMGKEGRFEAHLEESEPGKVIIYGNDWLTSDQRTNDPRSKLSYLLARAYTECFDIETESLNEKELEVYLEAIKKSVLDFTGLELECKGDFSEIDHQSLDVIDPRDIKNPEFIKEFVFNPETWLYTTWDSWEPEDDFYLHKKTVLFTLYFDLPGIGTKSLEITSDYDENYCYKISELLQDLGYSKDDKIFKYKNNDRILEGYNDFLTFGDDIKVIPRIKFPDDDN